jgi:hypothetical protein
VGGNSREQGLTSGFPEQFNQSIWRLIFVLQIRLNGACRTADTGTITVALNWKSITNKVTGGFPEQFFSYLTKIRLRTALITVYL